MVQCAPKVNGYTSMGRNCAVFIFYLPSQGWMEDGVSLGQLLKEKNLVFRTILMRSYLMRSYDVYKEI